eukprot:Opistho-2@56606
MMARRWLVTFDVRGTLLRVRGTAGQQYADAASRIGVRVAPDALEQSFLDAYRSIAKQHPNFGHGVRGHPEMRSRDWWCMVCSGAVVVHMLCLYFTCIPCVLFFSDSCIARSRSPWSSRHIRIN